ncbi:MAG: YkgJ family cysteine cluster protein [Desulforhopalus sp.]|nr:YkgJ family cysteine cluster protein [Desulforhopalus sp.]
MVEVSQIFSCQRCGYCCHGETTVSLNEDDRKRMVQTLKIPEGEVRRQYWRITGNIVQMKTVDGHCVFYDQGCKVHDGRPWRCAQWPLHPSILVDENNLRTIAESCPGINKNLSWQEFCGILRQLLDNSKCLC